ncbi:MAG TPA: SCO family protein [Thermoanaerobaculia bacterium]|jgi:protein SCO1/2|nr:SCO family protein [Thermoanaerobaculia bacterium]
MTLRTWFSLAPLAGIVLSLALSGAPAGAGPGATTELAPMTIPDVSLVDQDGKKIHFYRDLIQGKVVAVNFVFTTCSTICTPQGARFAELRKLLGAKAGKDVHLISVSIDPQSDTPAKLKAWSEKLGAGPGWTLVTGEKDEIVRLLKSLGAFDVDIKRHTPSLLLGNDRDKRWTRAYSLAPAAQLAELLDGLGGATTKMKEGK